MTTPFLQMIDDTSSATFLNGTTLSTYFIESGNWTPATAALRKSSFGGVGVYDDVTEEISCLIRGSTASDCYDKLDALRQMLDRAEQWSSNKNVAPVLLKFSPTGATVSSDSTPLTAVVLGRADGDETSGVALQPEWDVAALAFVLACRIRFVRRGAWTFSTETKTTSASGTSALVGVSFNATHPTESPIKIDIKSFPTFASMALPQSVLLISPSSNWGIFQAKTLTVSGYTSVSDSANNPVATNVLRYTPSGITTVSSAAGTLPNSTGLVNRLITCYTILKSSNTTNTWNISMTYVGAIGSMSITTPVVSYTASTTNPTVLCLGTIAVGNDYNSAVGGVSTFKVNVASSVASGTLDFDIFCFFPDDVIGSSVLNFNAFTFNALSTYTISIDPAYITLPQPRVALTNTPLFEGLSYGGNAFATHIGLTFNYVWLQPRSTYWRLTDSVGAIIQPTVDIVRYRSYITPR